MSSIIFWAAESNSRHRSVKELFLSKGAIDAVNAIEIESATPAQQATIERLSNEGVVVCVNGRYYFDEDRERHYWMKTNRHNWLVAFSLIVVAAILFLIINNR